MVRYTWALGNEKDDENTLDLKRINIMREEQLDERFLLNVNWKGQVSFSPSRRNVFVDFR